MRLSWLVSLLLLPVIPPIRASEPCRQPDLHPFASQVKAVQSQLLAFNITGEGEGVPPPLQSQIRAFKDAFALLGDAAAHCASAAIGAKRLEERLARLLDANKPVVQEVYDPKKPEQDDHIYGDDVDVKVTRPSNRPGMLLLDFRFDIECGFDSLLLGYEFDAGRWKRVLRWQSKDYDDIGGAFGDFFEYRIVQPTDFKSWVLVVGHGQPWCSSNMSGADFDVLQPSGQAEAQRVLFHKELIYYRGTLPTMRSTQDGIELRIETYSIDMDIVFRPVVYRFRITDTDFQRVQPLALNGRDFVDEWLQSPWADAERWNGAEELKELERMHADIAALSDYNRNQRPLFNFGPVRGCSDSKAHYQVELDEEWVDDKGHSRLDATRYFQIQEGKNSFTMLSASDKPDPHCTGHDIMPAE